MMLAMNDKLKRKPAVTLKIKLRSGLTIMLCFELKHHFRNLDLLYSVGSRRSYFLMAS